MEFRVLGPLEIRGDDGHLPLRGRHHPKLLAALLDDANHVVPADRLVTVLWDELPPDSARQQIQNVVAGLRKQLGPEGERLRTAAHGYMIEVAAHELDLLRCRDREAAAHRHRRAGRYAAAADELRAA